MKSFLFFFIFMLLNINIISQSIGDYRSRGNGNWKDVNIWSRWTGTSWVNATSPPTFSTNVTIHDEDIVTITYPGLNQYNECANLTLTSGVLNGNEGLNIFGNINVFVNAQIGDETSNPIIVISGENCIMSGLGGYYLGGIWKYEHWAAASISDLTIESGTIVNYKGISNQNFIKNDLNESKLNIIVKGTINCSQSDLSNNGYISLDGSNGNGSFNSGGSLTVTASGVINVGQIFVMNNNTNPVYSTTLNIYGLINARIFTFSSSGLAGGSFRVYDGGVLNIQVGGTFSNINNSVILDIGSKIIYSADNHQTVFAFGNYYNLVMEGSNGPINRTLSGNIGVLGKLTLKGTTNISPAGFVISYGSNASLEYSGISHTVSNAEWPDNFDKDIKIETTGKVQLNGNKSAFNGTILFTSGELDLDSYILSGTGSFLMTGYTKLYTKSVNGISANGNFSLTGIQTFSEFGTYVFNGINNHQYTGNLLPANVSNLIIDNLYYGGKVFLSNNLTVNTLLTRKRGELNLNGNQLLYGSNSGLLYDNGTVDLVAGDELPGIMNSLVHLSGWGKITLYSDQVINSFLIVDSISRLFVAAGKILTVNGNINNYGVVEGESGSKLYFGGDNFLNGEKSLIETYEVCFIKSGEQIIQRINRFHNSVHTSINTGAIVNFEDLDTLYLNYGTLTIQLGGRLNISGLFTIIGEGSIFDYGTIFINPLSSLVINGNNGINTNIAITLNLYDNNLNGSDGKLIFKGYNQLLAHNQGNITGASLNLILESGYLYVGPNTGIQSIISINGGFQNLGGILEMSPSNFIFNSDFYNGGISRIYRMDFKGSAIINTGTIEINNYLYFNNGGVQKVHGLTGVKISGELKIKSGTKLVIDNSISTPEQQQLTLIGGTGGTFTIEENGHLEINGNVTILGTEGCSSIQNFRCGTFVDYGQLTTNGNLWLCLGWVKMLGNKVNGTGKLQIGQEMSDYCDVTSILAQNLAVQTVTFEVPEGCGVDNGYVPLSTDGPTVIAGTYKFACGVEYAPHFRGLLMILDDGKFCGAWLSCYECLTFCSGFNAHGNVINLSNNPISVNLIGINNQVISGKFDSLNLNNAQGTTLSGNTSVNSLTLTNGIITTGIHTLTIGSGPNNLGNLIRINGHINGNLKRWIPNVNGTYNFDIGTLNHFRPANVVFTTAPNTPGTLTASFISSNPGKLGLPITINDTVIANCGIDGYWSIIKNDGFSGGTYNIELGATGFGGILNYELLRVLKRTDSSSAWMIEGVHKNASGSNSEPMVYRLELSNFSEFGIGGTSENPLPVEISTFFSIVEERDVLINWITETETNALTFEIERKRIDPNNDLESQIKWDKIGVVKAKGSSISKFNYTYLDKSLNSGKYFYRLKNIDIDGSFTYSCNILAEVMPPQSYEMSQNYPNPFDEKTKIDFQIPIESTIRIDIYDITGAFVETLVNSKYSEGYYSIDINATNYPAGIYVCRLFSKNLEGKEIIIQKKMVLIQ